MSILSANPAVRKREERLLIQLRLKQLEAAAFTPADVEEVGKLLVVGRIKLPPHARLTVITTVEDVRHKLFNTSTQVITHTADQLHTRLLRPLTVLQALEAGLIRRVERGWVWSETTYERLASGERSADG